MRRWAFQRHHGAQRQMINATLEMENRRSYREVKPLIKGHECCTSLCIVETSFSRGVFIKRKRGPHPWTLDPMRSLGKPWSLRCPGGSPAHSVTLLSVDVGKPHTRWQISMALLRLLRLDQYNWDLVCFSLPVMEA